MYLGLEHLRTIEGVASMHMKIIWNGMQFEGEDNDK